MEFLIHYKCAKILFLNKSVFINQLKTVSHLVFKQEVEALRRSYLKSQNLYTQCKKSGHNLETRGPRWPWIAHLIFLRLL